ncbi:putative acetyltransferase [Pirellulimonas nuda]|uniref:Putative acetyltransferase n=1 Tax=Pirellulimonas nuda TaxID=2528009 RepID=A0A518D6I8_9BACT|nr:GNAT family N-acetyltransferase [Pirellulimonas nuda]QDU87059.1 putative acetyltransferase [Pirellulimonas nuda]
MNVITADLANDSHAWAVLSLTDAYARDPMGNGRPLAGDVCERLGPALREHPTTVVLLAYDGDTPVGIATCFLGFSTFAARPLLNVHDLSVLPSHRGQGVGRMLLDAVADKARGLGCCKVTLEVLEANPARRIYEAAGFQQVSYGQGAGGALFLSKPLDPPTP